MAREWSRVCPNCKKLLAAYFPVGTPIKCPDSDNSDGVARHVLVVECEGLPSDLDRRRQELFDNIKQSQALINQMMAPPHAP